MKTILVLTDFSISADYTADYALGLAQSIGANLLLCNIYKRPTDENLPDPKSWPKQVCEENSINDLSELMARLKTKLDKEPPLKNYKPEIDQCSVDGSANLNLTSVTTKHDILLGVISAHSRHNYGGIFQKNHTWEIIDQANFPVMVIPYQTRFKPYRQISFATGMDSSDTVILQAALNITGSASPEVLITHITAKHQERQELQCFFTSVTYPKLSYHTLHGHHIVRLLKQQCADIDLLILTHHKHSFLQNIFSQNVTRRMAAHLRKPLLIFPQNVNN